MLEIVNGSTKAMGISKERGLWIAFALSVGIHAIGFGFEPVLPRVTSYSGSNSTPIRVIKLIQTTPAEPTLSENSETRQYGQSAQSSIPAASAVKPNDKAIQTLDKSDQQQSVLVSSKSTRYLESNEVDVVSELMSEWMLHTESLHPAEKISIQLSLYINEKGVLDKFEILATSVSQLETELLIRDLTLTTFRPALKNGKSVPSQKNVEILLDLTQPTFRLPTLSNNYLGKDR